MVTQDDVRLERSVKVIWAEVLELLAKRIEPKAFRSWVQPAALLRLTVDEAVIGVANEFAVGTIQRNHSRDIRECLESVLKRQLKLVVEEDKSLANEQYVPSIASITVIPERVPLEAQFVRELGPTPKNHLNAKYTFDSFVIGSHNRFSHSAA